MTSHQNAPLITPALVAVHGLKPDEYERLLECLEREPTLTELGNLLRHVERALLL